MSQKVIVDGYNVLFRVARLENSSEVSYTLWVERRHFLDVLATRVKEDQREWFIVFDGQEKKLRLERKGHLWVLFTGSGRTADELILEMLEGKTTKSLRLLVNSHHRKVIVITNDRELREKIRAIRPNVEVRRVESLI